MKLIRFGEAGKEKPGVLLADGRRLDASSVVDDYNEDFFAGGNESLEKLREWAEKSAASAAEISPDVRLGAPLARPGKIICVGLNYRKHAIESGMDIPTEPVLFFKAASSLCGPFDDLVIPKGGEKTDYEVELAIVIGKQAHHVEAANAYEHIAGYALHNDYSERAFQLEMGGQWVKGKSCDTFAPLGPFIATTDEITDPNNLGLWLKVNGETRQNSSTSDFIFDVPEVVSYISRFMTLCPGDVISTGTPPGVGLGFDPPRYLKPGDVVELGIDGLGSSRQTAYAYPGRSE